MKWTLTPPPRAYTISQQRHLEHWSENPCKAVIGLHNIDAASHFAKLVFKTNRLSLQGPMGKIIWVEIWSVNGW